jgi:parvulin-like peptidyl-prolyl isomerase
MVCRTNARSRLRRGVPLLLAAVLAGCGLSNPKATRPVVGPPPPRLSYTNDSPSEVLLDPRRDAASIQPAGNAYVSTSLNSSRADEFSDVEPVAYVNGEPILASEILEQYAGRLAEIRPQVPPQQYRRLRYQLIERDLETFIENKLLIQAFKSTLEKDQEAVLETAMSTLFDEQVANMKTQFGVNTDYELELKLQEENTSLTLLERAFANRVMASEYLRSKQQKPPTPSRVELLEYYQEIKDREYSHPARVRWQQIEISYTPNGGKAGALEILKQAVAELRDGADFADVAKKYSNGPGAAQGGYWDWMPTGSLANQEIEKALFSMPIGRLSDVFVGESSYQIVRVIEREPARYDAFEDVQESLKKKLAEKFTNRATDQVMQELRGRGTIATIFDRNDSLAVDASPEPAAEAARGTLFDRPLVPPLGESPDSPPGGAAPAPGRSRPFGTAPLLPFE